MKKKWVCNFGCIGCVADATLLGARRILQAVCGRDSPSQHLLASRFRAATLRERSRCSPFRPNLYFRRYVPIARGNEQLNFWIPPICSGLLLALAFPCHPQHPLEFLFNSSWVFVALVPILWQLDGDGFKPAFYRGWLAGFLFNLLTLYWVAHTQGGGAAVVGATGLLAAYLGLFVGAFAGLQNILVARWGKRSLWAAPFLWTATEYLISLGELGFPWLLLGHSQAAFPSLIQYASWTGVYGVSFWIATVNLLVASTLLDGRRRRMSALALFGALLLPYAHGQLTIDDRENAALDTVRVAVVQPNVSRREKWGPAGLQHSFDTLETLTRSAGEGDPDLVVWPETALPCYLGLRPDCDSRLASFVEEVGAPVLTGASGYDRQRREPYNSAFYYAPGRSTVQTYSKMHLVPFGERTPFRDSIPFLRDIDWTALTGDLGPAEFARGDSATLFQNLRAPFGVLICFESVFPDLARRSVRAGARLLVNITNDSWFGPTAGPYQHAQLAVLRAIENRVSIARSANTGISMFIDPFGRTHDATEIFTRTFALRDLPVRSGETFYTRNGDLFAHLTLLAAIAVVILAVAQGKLGKG